MENQLLHVDEARQLRDQVVQLTGRVAQLLSYLKYCHPEHPQPDICKICEYLGR